MSIKQEPDTLREDLADLDCNKDMKSVNGKNFLWMKTEHAIKAENSAIPNIPNSLEQCVKQEEGTFDDFRTQIFVSGDVKDIHRGLHISDDVFLNQKDQVKVYKCGTCPYSSNYLFDLDQHNISHGLDAVYFCDLCQSSYQYFLDLKYHLASHTADCENSSQPFYGRNSFFSEDQKSEEVEQAIQNYDPQNNDQNVNVKLCNYNYTYKLDCEMKWQNELLTGDGNSDVSNISNLQSQKLTDSSTSECEQYKYSHSTKELYSCDICDYTSTIIYDLKIHKRHHLGEKPYSCDLCRYTSAKLSDLNIHKRRHTGEKPYSCGLCSYTSTTSSNLIKHRRCQHPGENPYSCDLCSYTCATGSEIRIHKYSHRGKKLSPAKIAPKKAKNRTKKRQKLFQNCTKLVKIAPKLFLIPLATSLYSQ